MRVMRIETLYRTRTPQKQRSECYEIVIDILPWVGPRNFRFVKKHGCWHEESNAYTLSLADADAIERGVTLQEAEALYEAAKAECAHNGFVHSFAPDYSRDGSCVYEFLNPA
jgi:hypothetical protein